MGCSLSVVTYLFLDKTSCIEGSILIMRLVLQILELPLIPSDDSLVRLALLTAQ
jgi:hypothetical protein